MNIRTVILAFLAGRYPGAYLPSAIRQRANASGLLDKAATQDEVDEALRVLSNRMRCVEPQLDRTSGSVYWTATEDGVKQWHLDGQTHVGGA